MVWFLTGLWHGAAWNFILWGLYYGLLLGLEKICVGQVFKKLPRLVQHLYTIVIVVFDLRCLYLMIWHSLGRIWLFMFHTAGNSMLGGEFFIILEAVGCS